MKLKVILLFVFCASAFAKEAVLTTMVMNAISNKVNNIQNKELSPLTEILIQSKVSDQFLRKILNRVESKYKNSLIELPARDYGDELIEIAYNKTLGPVFNDEIIKENLPKVALHLYKMDVLENEDEWFDDDIYMFYVATDGIIPTGKVTSIYRGNDSGDSFLFTANDRVIFPTEKNDGAVPAHHLIVDYSVIESDGDDINEMKKITSVIVDLAATAFSLYEPSSAQVVMSLRSEVKKLSNLILERDEDDRHVTDTLVFERQNIFNLFSQSNIHNFNRQYSGENNFSDWEYRLNFRFIKIN
jgi:hypothetical protein